MPEHDANATPPPASEYEAPAAEDLQDRGTVETAPGFQITAGDTD